MQLWYGWQKWGKRKKRRKKERKGEKEERREREKESENGYSNVYRLHVDIASERQRNLQFSIFIYD